MLILGIDTSAKAAGAGVVKDGALLSDLCALTALTHSETLLTLTDRALKTAGVGCEELDAVAVSAGANGMVAASSGGPDIMVLPPGTAIGLIALSGALPLLAGLVPSLVMSRKRPAQSLRG